MSDSRVHRSDVDYVKAVALVAVVVMHAGPALHPQMTSLERALRQGWVNFHVPAFFLVSGFLYHRQEPIPFQDIVRRLGRLLVPYVVASTFIATSQFYGALDLSEFAFRLATGGAAPIYYYVFDMVLCIALLWPLSRCSDGVVTSVWCGLVVYVVAIALGWLPTPRLGFYWLARDPFYQFWFGYFVAGWLVARSAHSLVLPDWAVRMFPVLLVCMMIPYAWSWAELIAANETFQPLPMRVLYRAFYAIGVVGLLAMASRALRVHPVVKFLSEASLTIYLYHHIFQKLALPLVREFDPLLRVPLLVVVGLLGAAAIAFVARGVLGRRSRLLFGW